MDNRAESIYTMPVLCGAAQQGVWVRWTEIPHEHFDKHCVKNMSRILRLSSRTMLIQFENWKQFFYTLC